MVPSVVCTLAQRGHPLAGSKMIESTSRETVYQYLREQPKDTAPAMWSGAHADAE